MNTKPRADVVVIVPVLNRDRIVIDALDSIAAQTLSPLQLIVIDDGSTDGTVDSVQSWIDVSSLDFPAQLIRQPNYGAASARNRGITASVDCRYFAFLDSDDMWPSDFLLRCTREMAVNDRAVAVTCDHEIVDMSNGGRRTVRVASIAENAAKWMFLNGAGIASASLFSAAAIRRIGCYDEGIPTGHDADLFFRVSLLGPWLYAPGETATKRIGVGNQSGEEENLSYQFPDKMQRNAQIYERLVEQAGGKHVLPQTLCAAVLARKWYRAGRESMRAGNPADARRCFVRSTFWRRWNKAWFYLMASYLHRSPRSAS